MKQFIHNTYQLGIPDEWLDFSAVTIVGPSSGDYSPSITITSDFVEPGTSAQKYAAEQLEPLKEALEEDGYKVLKEEAIAVNNIQAYQRFHAFAISDEDSGTRTMIQQWQVYMIFGSEVVVITCTDRADNFEHSYPTFVEAVNQFQYRG